MKKLILLFCCVTLASLCYSQTNFKWEYSDSIPKTKQQIYSDTKMFIAQEWKSAKNVIENDDKDGGLILVKGTSIQNVSVGAFNSVFIYVYDYSVTFKIKDNKYKIIIDNVYCTSCRFKSYSENQGNLLKIQPFDSIYVKEKTGLRGVALSEKNALILMGNLKAELQTIFDDYLKYIENITTTNNDW